ncbi:MAG: HNH endonuclease [Rhizobiaceae bacterium]
MGSLYLSRLGKEERKALEKQLWDQQGGRCFISGKDMIIGVHELDIDHIVPTRDNGPDNPDNFALTLASYNRSKQAANLRVARVLARFDQLSEEATSDERGANLNDVLKAHGGASSTLRGQIVGDKITYVVSGDDTVTVPIHTDKLSDMRYFFAVLPITALHHDEKINPRPIGANIRGLIEEFYRKRPQLHIALGWIDTNHLPTAPVNVFDGQHKAAAQILLGATSLPVRVFIDPNFDILLTTNTNAGTTLRQVAFDKSVQRRLGSQILQDRMSRYRTEKELADDFEGFSEKQLVEFFKGEQRQITKYVLDNVRSAVIHSPDNKLRDFIEFAGKGGDQPFSYSAIEKTFYSKFIGTKMLETPWNHLDASGENPRDLEIQQLTHLMTLIADRIYIGKFDEELGARRIENIVQQGKDVPEPHLVAFRLAKEEVLYCWLDYVRQVAESYFSHQGKPIRTDRLFQYRFPDQLWSNISNFLDNLARLPLWVNREASNTVFGGKQTYAFWHEIFETGASTGGQRVMPSGININKMIQPVGGDEQS